MTISIDDVLLPDTAKAYQVGGRIRLVRPPRQYAPPGACDNCGGDGLLHLWTDEALSDSAGHALPPTTRYTKAGAVRVWLAGVPCPVCSLGERSEYRRLLQQRSGVPSSRWDVTVTSLRDIPAQAPMRKIVAGALAEPTEPVMAGFFGGYGVGKTWHLYALVNGFAAMGLSARYATQSQYLNRLRSTFDRDGERTAVVLKEYVAARVLCLDEIGTNVELTGWAAEQVRELLTRRADANKGITLLAGNMPPAKLGAEWGWLASRLRGGLITVSGADLRGQR